MRLLCYMLLMFFIHIGGTTFAAQYHFECNARCIKAYQAFTALKIQKGEQLLKQEREADPYNLIPVFLANYDDFLSIILTGDAQMYQQRKANYELRMNLLNKGNKNSPWYRYCKSSVAFQWALLDIYFDHYFNAGVKFRNSFLLLKSNQKLFPKFSCNNILGGMEEALVGTIPDKYQWIVKLLGMKGSVRGGVVKLESFLKENKNNGGMLQNDAVFYYCYIKFFLLSERKAVWSYLDKNYPHPNDNLLLTFLKANLAINDNKASLALQILNDRNKGKAYLSVPILDYETGIAALRLLNPHTPDYFKKYLKTTKGKIFIKSTLQKLSYYYLVQGNIKLAQYYRKQIVTKGNSLTDADKKAQRYATNGKGLPNAQLIAATLYCDGGAYEKALTALQNLKPSLLADKAEQTAYFYRYGRIYQLLGNATACFPFYKEAIRLGADLPGQFAARAALEMGHIYELQHENKQAIFYYKKCLGMKNKDFKDNLDQKAKAGLNRLGAT